MRNSSRKRQTQWRKHTPEEGRSAKHTTHSFLVEDRTACPKLSNKSDKMARLNRVESVLLRHESVREALRLRLALGADGTPVEKDVGTGRSGRKQGLGFAFRIRARSTRRRAQRAGKSLAGEHAVKADK